MHRKRSSLALHRDKQTTKDHLLEKKKKKKKNTGLGIYKKIKNSGYGIKKSTKWKLGLKKDYEFDKTIKENLKSKL